VRGQSGAGSLDVGFLTGQDSRYAAPVVPAQEKKPNSCLTSFAPHGNHPLCLSRHRNQLGRVFTLPFFLYTPLILLRDHLQSSFAGPLSLVIAFPSTCDQQTHTSLHCRNALIPRNSTFAVFPNVPASQRRCCSRHRLSSIHQSTVCVFCFHWLLFLRGSSCNLAIPHHHLHAPLRIHSALGHAKRHGASFATLLVSQWHVAPSTGPRLIAKVSTRRTFKRSSDTDRHRPCSLAKYKESRLPSALLGQSFRSW
jgi:hypothetical protein